MANWEFYDESDEVEGVDEKEPTFSLHDFKNWLSKQKGVSNNPLREIFEEDQNIQEKEKKDDLKEIFKGKINAKVNKNVERKLAERKKKKN